LQQLETEEVSVLLLLAYCALLQEDYTLAARHCENVLDRQDLSEQARYLAETYTVEALCRSQPRGPAISFGGVQGNSHWGNNTHKKPADRGTQTQTQTQTQTHSTKTKTNTNTIANTNQTALNSFSTIPARVVDLVAHPTPISDHTLAGSPRSMEWLGDAQPPLSNRDAAKLGLVINRGVIQAMRGNVAEAESTFRGTLSLFPHHHLVRRNLLWVLLRAGKFEEALALLNH
jgi:hypothetical protein